MCGRGRRAVVAGDEDLAGGDGAAGEGKDIGARTAEDEEAAWSGEGAETPEEDAMGLPWVLVGFTNCSR